MAKKSTKFALITWPGGLVFIAARLLQQPVKKHFKVSCTDLSANLRFLPGFAWQIHQVVLPNYWN